jgi:hypothetical protein
LRTLLALLALLLLRFHLRLPSPLLPLLPLPLQPPAFFLHLLHFVIGVGAVILTTRR